MSAKINLQTTTTWIGKRASLPWQMTARLAHPCPIPVQSKISILELAWPAASKAQIYSN
jgi:hypothetical protein